MREKALCQFLNATKGFEKAHPINKGKRKSCVKLQPYKRATQGTLNSSASSDYTNKNPRF
jgi:hypothetical protein